ncbi:MAG: DUF4893 domain-containing protein [Zhengella sp.]|uniref:DUF4893 domain-containing protein n=1 Tax=Zhengella sp. TaxID=2282762 RepID=UPI001E1183D7|nr:DUF4893 domain-containing protein [Notoacmeibacter sp.]MCC0028423.1 DUF4893 domain-containing protein [Brucellaceae bacterium]
MTRAAIASVVLMALAGSAGPANATGGIESLITDIDRQRLAAFDETRTRAIAVARARGAPADIAQLDEILDGDPVSFSGADLTGNWQCRITKLDGPAALVTYSWFRCRITESGAGLYLEKLTGSQRVTGHFFDDGDKRLIFLGAGHYSYEEPLPYPQNNERDEVAFAFLLDDGRLRLEFPAPHLESRFDIMELRR